MNGERIGGGGAGLVSQYNNEPVEATQTIYRPGWRSGKEEGEKKKEKEKSDFSFPSFDTATMAFGLEVTQQSIRGGAAICTIYALGRE